MMYCLPEEMAPDERLQQCVELFRSQHVAVHPFHHIQVRGFATLKAMVKRGAYANRERALERLSGFFYDLKHISSYAPYCQAFVDGSADGCANGATWDCA